MKITQRYLSTGQASTYAGLDKRSIRRMVETGVINGEKTPGGHWRIDRFSIDNYFDGKKKAVEIVRSLGL